MSEVTATLIGVVFSLVGVWVGYHFSRRASEGDRHAELQYTIYRKVEELKNLLMAFQKNKITQKEFREKRARAMEETLVALIRSGLSKDEMKKLLHAINGKWEKPESITKLQQSADDLLKKLSPKFADAAHEVLNDLGIKPEDLDPIA